MHAVSKLCPVAPLYLPTGQGYSVRKAVPVGQMCPAGQVSRYSSVAAEEAYCSQYSPAGQIVQAAWKLLVQVAPEAW